MGVSSQQKQRLFSEKQTGSFSTQFLQIHIQANNASLLKLPKIQYKRKKITETTTQSKPSNHRQKLVCMEKLSGTEVSWEQNVISQFW